MKFKIFMTAMLAMSLVGCATMKKAAIEELEMRVTDLEKRLQEKDDKIEELEAKLEKVNQAEQEMQAAKSDVSKATKKQIQTALKNAGFYNGPLDGKFGQQTTNAILEFQKVNNIKQDGKVGQQTWSKLSQHLQ